MKFTCSWWHGLLPRRWRRSHGEGADAASSPLASSYHDDFAPPPEAYPSFPPPAPSDLIKDREAYWVKISSRKYAAPQGVFEDSPLYALYRLYEFIVLDKVLDYRNALEAFWRQHQWKVCDIPEPDGSGNGAAAERVAFLAGCTYLLVRCFNERVKLGLQRDMSPLITPEEAEEARQLPDHLRQYEAVPEWAANVPALQTTLAVPTNEGIVLSGADDARADPDFLAKNILLWTPHISFT